MLDDSFRGSRGLIFGAKKNRMEFPEKPYRCLKAYQVLWFEGWGFRINMRWLIYLYLNLIIPKRVVGIIWNKEAMQEKVQYLEFYFLCLFMQQCLWMKEGT